MKSATSSLLTALALSAGIPFLRAETRTAPDPGLAKKIERSAERGIKALEKVQNEDGSWGSGGMPAMTALPVLAYLTQPGREPGKERIPANIRKALDFLASKARPDGGIYERGMGTYNTALCVLALHASGEKEYRDIILKARCFLIDQQGDFDKKGVADNATDGGIGYGPGDKNTHADLSNTYLALEALHETKNLLADAPKSAGEEDLDWEAAITFVTRCQNLPETNDQKWASDDADNRGGFIYLPGQSVAGEVDLPDGGKALRSYGSMSYAGLLSYIYAEMDKDDERVKAVMEWLTNHYSVDENPGVGDAGLYYYLHTMSKALAISGTTKLELENGKSVDWRHDVAEKLTGSQKADGTWVNSNGRWWENDPILATCFAVLSLGQVDDAL